MTVQEEKKAVLAVVELARVLIETVVEVGRAPSGVCYLAFSQRGISLTAYNRIVDLAVGTGLIKKVGDELVAAG